jgi:hypothetical protein
MIWYFSMQASIFSSVNAAIGLILMIPCLSSQLTRGVSARPAWSLRRRPVAQAS